MRRPVRALRLLGGVSAVAALLGCTSPKPIEEAGKGPPLAPREKTYVREQVTKASAAKEWTAAWNQEIAAGGDRATLESIAVDALEDDAGDAEAMFRDLRAHGPLRPEARKKLDLAVQRAEAKDRWTRAVEIAITSAEDPPAFAKAWEVYRAAPPDEALSVLEKIRKAKDEHVEAQEPKESPAPAKPADAPASGTPR